MTDRLAALLHAEAEALEVPAAPASEIVSAGHHRDRQRVFRAGAVAVAASALVVGGVAVVAGRDQAARESPSSPLGHHPRTPQIAYAVGTTVYLGHRRATASLPEFGQALYLTSSGLVVRTNATGIPDGRSPYHFVLVGASGRTRGLHGPSGDVAPSADPREPYLAWATMNHGKITVVVHDVATDRDVAHLGVPGTFTWGGWDAPPVALSGADVYVGTDHQTHVVNWRTGVSAVAPGVPGSSYPTVAGGRAVVTHSRTADIVDAASGRRLLRLPIRRDDSVNLSPDGRFATVDTGYGDRVSPYEKVYSVADGSSISLPGTAWGYGWTYPGDDLFRVEGTTMTTCAAATGHCHTTVAPPGLGGSFVHYAGRLYEA
ncbi:MAG: hypothetical protein WAV00_21110 [Nocardioides sp.]